MFSGEKEEELKGILLDYRTKLREKINDIYGTKVGDVCPLADKLIERDQYLDSQDLIESSAYTSGKIEYDRYYIRRKFDRQFNTMIDYVWILIYESISDASGLGPYVTQLFNFDIEKVRGQRVIFIAGFWDIFTGAINQSGAIMLFWFNEIGELDENARDFLPFLSKFYPKTFERMWQEDMM